MARMHYGHCSQFAFTYDAKCNVGVCLSLYIFVRRILPEISGVFKHPKHPPPLVTALIDNLRSRYHLLRRHPARNGSRSARRGIAIVILSVRLSVRHSLCLSVCNVRAL